MNAPRFRPLASKEYDGRIGVYISGGYYRLPEEAAQALLCQLGMALGVPTGTGIATFAAKVLDWYRNDGCPGDVDGGDIQECALKNALLEPVDCPEGGCGAHCECEAGDICYYRYSAQGMALMALLDRDAGTVAEVRL